jgi:hypothetical protein
MQDSIKDTFYTRLFENLIAELDKTGTKLEPSLAPLFFTVMRESLVKALDKTFIDLTEPGN